MFTIFISRYLNSMSKDGKSKDERKMSPMRITLKVGVNVTAVPYFFGLKCPCDKKITSFFS